MSAQAVPQTEAPRACTICCVPESVEPGKERAVYTCDGCDEPVCSGCSESGPDNTVVCDNCVADGKLRGPPRTARFKVDGRIDGADGCNVEINRGNLVFSVRPFRRRRTYELPLVEVARYVLERIAKGETLKRQAEKRKKKRDRLKLRRRR